MSDDAAKHFESEASPEMAKAAQGRSVTVTITLHPNGQIEFNLPANKVLAHGLLGVAQEQLTKLTLMAELQQQIPKSRGGIDGLLKRMNGGN